MNTYKLSVYDREWIKKNEEIITLLIILKINKFIVILIHVIVHDQKVNVCLLSSLSWLMSLKLKSSIYRFHGWWRMVISNSRVDICSVCIVHKVMLTCKQLNSDGIRNKTFFLSYYLVNCLLNRISCQSQLFSFLWLWKIDISNTIQQNLDNHLLKRVTSRRKKKT